ncbi:MAG: dimethyl sulfoxide reductase anchor subunit [Gammaproteobacteria bacterium]|nr:dimethyl sulfoxide reductase anchor subunit [Gammaproteobacteria bacterium]
MSETIKPEKYFLRDDEQSYAFLADAIVPEKNCYGKEIQLVDENNQLAGKSLHINGDSSVSDYADRYKQHGFYFNADNCISCHACESACSEKNDLPAHLAYRAVGYLEGGSYPSYSRLNISMACNHCDDPVCLKGCPTRAYTKFAEYGAVLQDPDICFGCGYCTWVCPYNAPQLDMTKGHVHKCNMCVDRLEQGLKPACAAACLAGALDFGVTETTPENRQQLKTQIPGFPSPDITHPNIRFQQTKSLPNEMRRTDSVAVKYQRSGSSGEYQAELDISKADSAKYWNLKKLLSSHENAHIIFTLSSQAVIGAFLLYMLAPLLGLEKISSGFNQAFLEIFISLFALFSLGMIKLNLHLGKPQRFYRGFNNWRLSPLSREIAGVSLFFIGFAGFGLVTVFEQYNILAIQQVLNSKVLRVLSMLTAVLAISGAVIGLYYMIKLYLIPTRPYWNHWQTASSFVSTTLVLGAVSIVLVSSLASRQIEPALIHQAAIVALCGLLLEAAGLIVHARDLKKNKGEGALSHFEQTTRFGNAYVLRNLLLALNTVGLSIIVFAGLTENYAVLTALLLMASIFISALIGRALFYVLVVPTSMPGAFFWRNKGFQQHARETGLAKMQQVGVLPD